MRQTRKTLMITSILFMAIIWAFIALEKGTDIFKGLDLFVFILIMVLVAIAMFYAWKRDKEAISGQHAEDEFSMLIKYKSGYYAYLFSMYMWLFIFILKDHFPNVESMIGGGILLSALISVFTKIYAKRSLNE